MLHFVTSCQLSNIIDFLPDVGFRAAVDEHITHVLLSVVADIYLGTANLQLSESHLKSIINIFNEGRNYPPLSPESKYSYKGIRRLLGYLALARFLKTHIWLAARRINHGPSASYLPMFTYIIYTYDAAFYTYFKMRKALFSALYLTNVLTTARIAA